MPVELTESLLSNAAGWEAMKRARAYLAMDQVLSSYWAAPLLRGVVQVNGMSFRASMVIHNGIDIENLCNCRDARETGQICAHSVAVGLHWIAAQKGASSGGDTKPAPGRSAGPDPVRSSGLRHDPQGLPCELAIILPPSMARPAQAGRIMLVLEARVPGRTCPLNALSRERAYAFSEQDRKVIEAVEGLAGGQTPGMLQLSAEQFAKMLPLLEGHPAVTLGRSEPAAISGELFELPLCATLQANGEILLELKEGAVFPIRIGDWVFVNGTFHRAGPLLGLGDLSSGPVRLSRSQVPGFLGAQWPRLAATSEANFRLEDFSFEPRAPKFILSLSGGMARLTGLLQCAYGSRIMTPKVTAMGEDVWLPDPSDPRRYSTRDFGAEQAAVARLQRCGFIGPDDRGGLQMSGQNAVLNFFAREFPRLEREWAVSLDDRLDRSAKQNIERIEPRFTITPSGVQWFDLGVVFASPGGEQFPAAEIQRLLLSGQSHVRLPNGKAAVFDTEGLEELQEVLRDCAPRQHEGGYRIDNAQAAFVDSALRERGNWQVQAPEPWRRRVSTQSGSIAADCPPLGDLDAVLRPYQKKGVAWLHFLRANGFGGVLADEMGLGKTLQALALFSVVREQSRGPGPMLVVCPTSLVFNWIAEARKFTPRLKALAIHGPDRGALFDRIPAQDVVVTSYALMRRDAAEYRRFEFDTIALDEAQHIKNRQTQNAQAVKSVRARQRLVLTGTPLENSVLDLWSIFDFLMPGYLGTAADFRERYEGPIAREKDPRVQARLARRLRPFLLRRTKREVAPELPEKIQQVAYCELTEDQRAVYQQVIEAARREVLDAAGAEGEARGRMVALTALLRLRQVCCDLRLLRLDGVDPSRASGKLDLFSELLEEAIDGGHRSLVFSQFTSMLSIIKEQLEETGVEYCYLDGSTTNRLEVVERFQRDASIPVFLISLKAGGVGLNLTGADTVIHFDPWWNPAVEDQATDRAHRIGQERVVTSYKLISRDTVEEKILSLQHRKREIIQATITGEEQFASGLSWDELRDLLEIG